MDVSYERKALVRTDGRNNPNIIQYLVYLEVVGGEGAGNQSMMSDHSYASPGRRQPSGGNNEQPGTMFLLLLVLQCPFTDLIKTHKSEIEIIYFLPKKFFPNHNC